ncbi:MAG: hypothetical protein NC132_04710 [Corallococcus sp.]|nr:hypothetical protein [Corallococcus sp.]MCM1359688.1 hypothetical protein [Corallococcus sp.]MCM1395397.1 hypothetical protein [Corallococcus sp.]
MDQQISDIVETAVSNLSKVAEVNTIIGKPIVTMDGTTIMPISQITFAFMAGGGEYGNKVPPKKFIGDGSLANFAGGSGGGASLTPVGFLVIDREGVRVIEADRESTANKIFDVAKDVVKSFKN